MNTGVISDLLIFEGAKYIGSQLQPLDDKVNRFRKVENQKITSSVGVIRFRKNIYSLIMVLFLIIINFIIWTSVETHKVEVKSIYNGFSDWFHKYPFLSERDNYRDICREPSSLIVTHRSKLIEVCNEFSTELEALGKKEFIVPFSSSPLGYWYILLNFIIIIIVFIMRSRHTKAIDQEEKIGTSYINEKIGVLLGEYKKSLTLKEIVDVFSKEIKKINSDGKINSKSIKAIEGYFSEYGMHWDKFPHRQIGFCHKRINSLKKHEWFSINDKTESIICSHYKLRQVFYKLSSTSCKLTESQLLLIQKLLCCIYIYEYMFSKDISILETKEGNLIDINEIMDYFLACSNEMQEHKFEKMETLDYFHFSLFKLKSNYSLKILNGLLSNEGKLIRIFSWFSVILFLLVVVSVLVASVLSTSIDAGVLAAIIAAAGAFTLFLYNSKLVKGD
jgi:hypothetical protein